MPVDRQQKEAETIANGNVLLVGKADNDSLTCQQQHIQLPLTYKTPKQQERETKRILDSSLRQKLTEDQLTNLTWKHFVF